MRVQCDFSVGFDGEIEDIDMYPDNHLSKRIIRNLLTDVIEDKSLFVGERCKGSVHYSNTTNSVVIKSESCVEVGEDWNDDKWSDNPNIDFPSNRLRV
jgi:hypothetical protein